jgi:hypothetical protein
VVLPHCGGPVRRRRGGWALFFIANMRLFQGDFRSKGQI